MDRKADFYRVFLIFINEDEGYGLAQKPSGHVRIEVREGRGKLKTSVQNLLENGKFLYRLYLVNTASGRFEPVSAGLLEFERNKAELEFEFDPLNVGGSGRTIQEFGIAAVLVEYRDRENTSIICPLAAYGGVKQSWRNGLTEHLYIKKAIQQNNIEEAVTNILPPESVETIPDNMEIQAGNNVDTFQQPEYVEPVQEPQLNANPCAACMNTGAANMCSSCTLNSSPEDTGNPMKTGNIESLRGELDKNFERFDPFHVRRSDYIWWKVTNPASLNNIFYQCGIRSPLLFNPVVMVSHYKYGHILTGIYTDRMSGREYAACGVFGMNMVDRKPFGDLCMWVQTEGTKPKYGAFGYWIVFIDPATGRLLNVQ